MVKVCNSAVAHMLLSPSRECRSPPGPVQPDSTHICSAPSHVKHIC